MPQRQRRDAAHTALDHLGLSIGGRGDLTALLLGSVAHKVIHLADRPVLVVR